MFLNRQKSKQRISRDDNTRREILTFLRNFSNTTGEVQFHGIENKDRIICAHIYIYGSKINLSYMQIGIRNFCTELAEAFRCVAGRNVFFDIVRGVLTVHV